MTMTRLPDIDERPSYLLLSFNALSVVLTLTVYFGSALLEAFQQRTVKPAESSKDKQNVWTKTLIFQLSTTAVIIALHVIHSILLGISVFVPGKTDSNLVSTLFLTLTWVVLLLGLIEREEVGGSAYLRAWSIAGIFEVAAFVLVVACPSLRNNQFLVADLIVQVICMIAVAALVSGSILLRQRKSLLDSNATEEEIQPLLENGSAELPQTNGKSNDKTPKKEEKDEDEDEREEIVDKEALDELKRRPLRQYIGSFAVFLPHVMPHTHQQWMSIGVMLICTVIQRAINVALPLSLGTLVNSLSNAHSMPWGPVLVYLSITVLSSAGLVSMIYDLASAKFATAAKLSLDRFCYNHIMTLSSDFHEGENSNRLGRLIDRGDMIADLFQLVVFRMFPQISDLFISLAVLAWLFGGYLCFIVATTIVFFAWANTKFIRKKIKLRRSWWNAMQSQWQHLWETNYNWMTVSHFGRVPHEINQFEIKTQTMYERGLATTVFDALAQFIRQAIVALGFIAAAMISISQIVFGSGSVGDFVMLVTYWNSVMSPVTGLIRLANRASEELVDAERLLVVLEQKPKVKDTDTAKDFDFQGGSVEFEDVSFSYDGQRIVSEDISFHINAGQTVAIVGETGGGKSTLLKLLFRFYDTTKGRIFIDGQDIRDLKMQTFREHIGFVPQDPAMFERSVADNVRYPDLEATDDDVVEACKGAVLHDKIMTFTDGYKQKVGKKGAKLSGGEQQRLAIARCIIKKPNILLLDEATSSVDSITETKIHEGLRKLCKGKTTFIIAHRLSTILHADQILVMKNGKLVEAGPHRVLIKQEGAYRELWEAQLKLQEANPDADEEKETDKETMGGLKYTTSEALLKSLETDTEVEASSSKSSDQRIVAETENAETQNEDNLQGQKREHDIDDMSGTKGQGKD